MTAPATPEQSGFVERAMELVEVYAGETSELHTALRIDVGVDRAYSACSETEEKLRAYLASQAAVMDALVGALEGSVSLLEFIEPEVKGGYSPDGALTKARAALALAKGQP